MSYPNMGGEASRQAGMERCVFPLLIAVIMAAAVLIAVYVPGGAALSVIFALSGSALACAVHMGGKKAPSANTAQ